MAFDYSQLQFDKCYPSPPDARDFRLSGYIPVYKPEDLAGEMIWQYLHIPLNQKRTGHCCGFGYTNWKINLPVQDECNDDDAHAAYYGMKILDGEPGAEDGSCVRTVARYGVQEGRMKHYAFAATINDVVWWILNKGPVIVGTDWTVDMMNPDKDNVIHPTGDVVGRHCYEINSKLLIHKMNIQNSWGATDWGINGHSLIDIDDFEKLMHGGGEVIAAVEEPLPTIPVPQNSCVRTILKLLGLI